SPRRPRARASWADPSRRPRSACGSGRGDCGRGKSGPGGAASGWCRRRTCGKRWSKHPGEAAIGAADLWRRGRVIVARQGKRGNGEGSITPLSDGRWQARVTLPDGKRKAFYGKTRKEAAAKLTVALADLERGLPIIAERQTVG